MGQGADDMDMEWARAVPVRAPWPTKDETIAELVEALETAQGWLLWCAREGRMASPSLSRFPERWAEDLALKLTKIKEGV